MDSPETELHCMFLIKDEDTVYIKIVKVGVFRVVGAPDPKRLLLMTTYWYALHSKPHKEELLAEQLELRRIETFAPRIRYR